MNLCTCTFFLDMHTMLKSVFLNFEIVQSYWIWNVPVCHIALLDCSYLVHVLCIMIWFVCVWKGDGGGMIWWELTTFLSLTELPEFMIYVTGGQVHRVMLGSNHDEVIYSNSYNNIRTAEFDLSSNCMFIGLTSEIQVCWFLWAPMI